MSALRRWLRQERVAQYQRWLNAQHENRDTMWNEALQETMVFIRPAMNHPLDCGCPPIRPDWHMDPRALIGSPA
jgi:hypothetical protein